MEWHDMQLTPFSAWTEFSAFIWCGPPAWQVMQRSSSSLTDRVENLTILVGSPPAATCAARVQGRLPVRRFVPSLVNIFVAGLADFRAHVPGILRIGCGCCGR